jgi:hypothetical protein
MAPFNFKCNLDANFTLTQRVALLPTVKITDKGGALGVILNSMAHLHTVPAEPI